VDVEPKGPSHGSCWHRLGSTVSCSRLDGDQVNHDSTRSRVYSISPPSRPSCRRPSHFGSIVIQVQRCTSELSLTPRAQERSYKLTSSVRRPR
jgi:hypothetical protein